MALPRQAENPTFKPNEIGRELGITQMHVSRLLARILEKLRRDIAA